MTIEYAMSISAANHARDKETARLYFKSEGFLVASQRWGTDKKIHRESWW